MKYSLIGKKLGAQIKKTGTDVETLQKTALEDARMMERDIEKYPSPSIVKPAISEDGGKQDDSA